MLYLHFRQNHHGISSIVYQLVRDFGEFLKRRYQEIEN